MTTIEDPGALVMSRGGQDPDLTVKVSDVSDRRTWSDRGYPHGIAAGWYQIGWSGELSIGQIKSIRYFGIDLVLFRTEDGTAHVFDAHCAHLGANLARGGTVVGNQIQCPFHGWRWDQDGKNTLIPYSEHLCRGKKMRVWSVRESGGLLLLWFHPEGDEPSFDILKLPEADSADYYPAFPAGACLWRGTAIHPQSPVENMVDPAHLVFVHGAGHADMNLETEIDGPYFRKVTRLTFGHGKPSTIITPHGPRDGLIESIACGLGYFIARFQVQKPGVADMILVTSTTPIDEYRSDFRQTVIPLREDNSVEEWSRMALWWVKEERRQAEADHPIWEYMNQVKNAPFAREEAKAYLAMRHWAEQFYN